jgi:Tfp pilus assembly protein FimT
MKGQGSQHGFSLVELVVALEFGAIIALMGVPNVNAFFARYQLMSASNQLGFDITRARMQAVGHNRFVRIRMLSGTQYAREESPDGNTWSNQVTTKLPNGMTSTTASAEVRFDRGGFAAVNNSIVVKNNLQQAKTVVTSVVGRVSITSEAL